MPDWTERPEEAPGLPLQPLLKSRKDKAESPALSQAFCSVGRDTPK